MARTFPTVEAQRRADIALALRLRTERLQANGCSVQDVERFTAARINHIRRMSGRKAG